MTSFHAMTCATKGIVELHNLTEFDRYFSYYPISHSIERWLGECMALYTGMEVFFPQSEHSFDADMDRARPTIFFAVPRLWTKFQAGVSEKKLYSNVPLVKGARKKKILKKLGLGKVRVALSGSAPISSEILQWYRNKVGLEILEGYGMTENFNFSHTTRVGDSQPGCVGRVWDGVEQHIGEDGEIHVLSPCHMLGYFGDDQGTVNVMSEDGWMRTGDKGELDAEGRLQITGRIMDVFETSEGVYVDPARIEKLLVANHLIEMSCVCGHSYPQPHAVVQLCREVKAQAAKGELEREKITLELEDRFEAANLLLEEQERLSFLMVVFDDWLPECGFLTPTHEVLRAAIEETYRPSVNGWYECEANTKVVWVGWPAPVEGEQV